MLILEIMVDEDFDLITLLGEYASFLSSLKKAFSQSPDGRVSFADLPSIQAQALEEANSSNAEIIRFNQT